MAQRYAKVKYFMSGHLAPDSPQAWLQRARSDLALVTPAVVLEVEAQIDHPHEQ